MIKFRQIVAVIFLAVFAIVVFNYSFFRAYIKLKKSDFRKEIAVSFSSKLEKVEMDKCDLYRDKNAVEWVDENKEVVINGKFYEVISIVVSGNKAVISITKDEQENRMFSSFFSHQSENNVLLFNILKLIQGATINSVLSYNFIQGNEVANPQPIYKKGFITHQYFFKLIKPPRYI